MAEVNSGNGESGIGAGTPEEFSVLQTEKERLLEVVVTMETTIRDAMGAALENGVSYPQITYVLDMLSLDLKINLRETWQAEVARAEKDSLIDPPPAPN